MNRFAIIAKFSKKRLFNFFGRLKVQIGSFLRSLVLYREYLKAFFEKLHINRRAELSYLNYQSLAGFFWCHSLQTQLFCEFQGCVKKETICPLKQYFEKYGRCFGGFKNTHQESLNIASSTLGAGARATLWLPKWVFPDQLVRKFLSRRMK